MKAKSLSTIVFSTLGVAALFLLLVAVNYICAFGKQRIDLTEDHSFTLSGGTRNIIHKLDTPVTIRFYVTQDNEMPTFFKDYAKRVEDLLGEYQQLDPKHIIVKKLDPQPDSDAEDSAKLDGVDGQQLPSGEKVYLGLSISMLDQKKAIPMLDPQRERQLEYDITSAISSVITTEKPVIGIMSPLPVAGMNNPMMAQMGQQGRPAWAFYSQLKDSFTVKDIDMGVSEIPADVKVLVLIHPKALRPGTEFAIDQFVLRGGKLIAFLDPLSVLDQQQGSMGFSPPSNSTFDSLLKAWGITFNVEKVIADMTYCADTRNGKQPAILALSKDAFNKDDIVTSDADNAVFPFAGVFSSTSTAGLQLTPLISTSKQSELVDGMEAQSSGETILNKFDASGIEYPLAVRLTGTFKTAFPQGAPADTADSKQPPKPPTGAALQQSAQTNTVILFGDADFIQDPVAVNEMENPFGGQERVVMPANGNLNLAQSAVEQMAGDNDLIALRSRGVTERPFTLVKQIQEKAEDSYRGKIEQLENNLRDTESKLSDLQHTKDNGQKYILSNEQQQEIANFRKTEADTHTQLKDVRKNLRSDIDSLETRLNLFNILMMPLLVAIFGIIAGIIKHQRAAAR